jgi:hypothetical protein
VASDQLVAILVAYAGDESRVLDLTVWNKAAALYHSSLSALPIGTLIAVTGYRVKFWNGDYEGSVNMTNPRGRLFIVSERTFSLE